MGLRYSLSQSSNFIASFIYSDFDGKFKDFDDEINEEIIESDKVDGLQGEAQHLFRNNFFNVTAGVGVYHTDDLMEGFEGGNRVSSQHLSVKHETGYFYSNVIGPKAVTWTFGISYDDYDEGDDLEENFQPGDDKIPSSHCFPAVLV